MDDSHWASLPPPRLSRRVEPRSFYCTMRDGVRIAIDVYLPPDGPARAPAIIRQTRYLRRVRPRFGTSVLVREFDLYQRTRRVFLAAGYAWIDVDVRGTGASSGAWISPWSPDEVADGAQIVDWIIAQPWSNGTVGSLGISYDGTCADMLVTTKHPAVRAIAPMFALYDIYSDVAFPGGILLAWFVERWATYNAAFDRNSFADALSIPLTLMGLAARTAPRPNLGDRLLGWLARDDEMSVRRRLSRLLGRLATGVRPVEEEPLPAFDRRANMDVHVVAKDVVCRDDRAAPEILADGTIDSFSPHTFRAEAIASGVPIYSYSGWRDAAYPHAAVKRYLSIPNPGSRMIIGPWVHTGKVFVPPFAQARPTAFDHDAELLAFFDEHLRGKPRRDEPVRYYTVGTGWKSAASWPPPATPSPFYLEAGRSLVRSPCESATQETLRETGETGSGVRARWRCLVSLVPGDYPDRRTRGASLLHYDSAVFERDTEVTGHPILVVHVSCNAEDAHLFAYLEDVRPDGEVAYVTEGQLRLLHRKLAAPPFAYESPVPHRHYTRADTAPLVPGEVTEVTFDLLPISWCFAAGHRARLTLTGADRDHFTVMAPRTLEIHAGGARPSRLVLPII